MTEPTGARRALCADSDARVNPNHNPELSRRGLLTGSAAFGGGIIGAQVFGGDQTASAQRPGIGNGPRAVVTAHSMATEAGMAMLQQGGTAADAAVSVAAVLSVVESWFSSALGGGTWGMYYDAGSQELTSLDAVGPVGQAVDVGLYETMADQPGIHQAIVPGAWDGWMLWLDRYGRLDLGTVLAPAIEIAREGFPASTLMVFWLNRLEEEVRAHPDAARTYLRDGQLPEVGDLITLPDLATSFERLAESYATSTGTSRSEAIQSARDFFYRGPLAEEIVDYSAANNGFLIADDFAAFAAEIVEPISINYTDDITIYQCPPNSQGMTMLMALNIIKGINFEGQNIEAPDVIHAQVEAVKLAFADRYAWIGDPDRVEIPVEELLSDAYAEQQRSRIAMDQAAEWPIDTLMAKSEQTNTSTFHIVDGAGNIAGATTSIGAQFLIAGETGIHMNARMPFLSLDPQEPNAMTPGYKVRHTSCPYMVFRNGRPWVTAGNTGVDTQPQAQMQQFLSMVDFGLSPQRAVDRPRFVSTSFPETVYPYPVLNVLQLERGFTDELIAELEARGHVVGPEGIVGTAAIIAINADGAELDIGVESRVDTASGLVVASEAARG